MATGDHVPCDERKESGHGIEESLALDRCDIQGWRVKEGSRGESFAVYLIKVHLKIGLAWVCEKRYTQFRHLRRDVNEAISNSRDLAFPEKRFLPWFNLTDSNLKHRSKLLENYLNKVIEMDCELEALLTFLQVVNNVSLLARRQPSSSFKKLKKAGSMVDLYNDKAPTAEDFHVMRIIGQGSFGQVYLVRPGKAVETTSEVYAMKVLKKAEVVRRKQVGHTLTERKIMAEVSHPFIIVLKFAFHTSDTLYMVTEYCPGGELYFHLKRRKTFSVNMMQFYSAQIAMALEYLHHKNIIYRDLKPENVLLDRDGNCRLTDFGLSKIMSGRRGEPGGISSTSSAVPIPPSIQDRRALTFCGTPEYLSPEMLLHRQRGSGYGEEIDWWSLGIVCYEMVVGWVPFFDRDFHRMCEKILHRPLKFPNKINLPEDARKFIKGLLQRDPRRRLCSSYHRAGELKTIPFFANSEFDFDCLERGLLAPPFIPRVNSALGAPYDTSNFENEGVLNKIASIKERVNEKEMKKEREPCASQRDPSRESSRLGGSAHASASNDDQGSPEAEEGPWPGFDQGLFANFTFPPSKGDD